MFLFLENTVYYILRRIYTFKNDAQREEYLLWAIAEMQRGVEYAPQVEKVISRDEWQHIMTWANAYLSVVPTIRQTINQMDMDNQSVWKNASRLNKLLNQIDAFGDKFIRLSVGINNEQK